MTAASALKPPSRVAVAAAVLAALAATGIGSVGGPGDQHVLAALAGSALTRHCRLDSIPSTGLSAADWTQCPSMISAVPT